MMDSSDILVLTPPGFPDPSLAIGAVRAGARGTLDLEYARLEDIAEPVVRLARFGRGPFGVKLGANAAHVLPLVLAAHRPAWAVLAGGSIPEHAATARQIREAGVEVLA